jgi:hydroxyacylglutathione hydrolase
LAPTLQIPLEDELGDVLEKAMSCAGLTPRRSPRGPASRIRIRDAIDYRPELGPAECAAWRPRSG